MQLLLGRIAPTAGVVTHGASLEIVYYDQLRAQIDDHRSVADNIANGAETISIDGRSRHVITYLQDFLFAPERSRTPARVLSGGERNRLLLARLFTKPANVLVLDERPTTSTPRRSNSSRTCWWSSPARCCSSATTASSSITSSPARSCSRATAASASTLGAAATGWRWTPPAPPRPRGRSPRARNRRRSRGRRAAQAHAQGATRTGGAASAD